MVEEEKMGEEEEAEFREKMAELEPYWRGCVGLYVPVFSHHIRLIVGSDEDAMMMVKNASANMRELVQPTQLSSDTNTSGVTRTRGEESVILMRRLWLESDIDISVLYHEALHVAIAILKDRGIEADEKGEITAWLMQHIALGLISRLKAGEFFTLKPDGTKSQALNRPIVSMCSLAEHITSRLK